MYVLLDDKKNQQINVTERLFHIELTAIECKYMKFVLQSTSKDNFYIAQVYRKNNRFYVLR